jgi:hypothetical protein
MKDNGKVSKQRVPHSRVQENQLINYSQENNKWQHTQSFNNS